MAGAGQVSTEGTFPTPATFLKGVVEPIGERRATAGVVKIGGVERIEEVVSIEGALKKGESGRSAEERTESAAAARTAATSRFTDISRQDQEDLKDYLSLYIRGHYPEIPSAPV
jgi:hypothetical protein